MSPGFARVFLYHLVQAVSFVDVAVHADAVGYPRGAVAGRIIREIDRILDVNVEVILASGHMGELVCVAADTAGYHVSGGRIRKAAADTGYHRARAVEHKARERGGHRVYRPGRRQRDRRRCCGRLWRRSRGGGRGDSRRRRRRDCGRRGRRARRLRDSCLCCRRLIN